MIFAALPLALTISRIFFSIIILVFFKINNISAINIIMFIAAITDFLDGYLARKLKVTTVIGSILDPLADKLFIASCLLGLYLNNLINPIFFAIFLLKDFLLIFWFIFKKNKNQSVKPLYISKISTALQFLANVFIINKIMFAQQILHAALILVILTLAMYTFKEYNGS